MATPSLAMIPSAIADAKVFSVLPNNGDGDFTFNRDSSATRVGQNGLIQTVGYFGSEEVTNGDFATDSDWVKGTGWTISGGKANANTVGDYITLYQNSVLTIGKNYKSSFTVTDYTQGTIRLTQGGSDISGQKNSVGTYVNYFTATNTTIDLQGISSFIGSIDNVSVKEVLGDQPRLNYDISNGVVQSCPSLLLEPASTNLITYSEAFDNAYWTKSGSSVASGFTSPSGDLSAFKFAEDGTNSYHYCRRLTVAVASASIVTLSLFAKKSENSYVALFEGRSGGTVFFNLETKTVVSASGGASGTIEQLPNDWCKIALTVTVPSTIANFEIYNSNDGTSLTYQGVSGNGVYIWGAQLEEALSYATSYIPTLSGASQTRAAESCFGAGTSSTFNDSEGTIFLNFASYSDYVISLDNGTSTNRIQFFRTATNDRIYIMIGSTFIINEVYRTTSNGVYNKYALAYKSGNILLYVNGVLLRTYTTAFTSTPFTQFNFNQFDYNASVNISLIESKIYNEALTDAQLQTLTTL